MRVPSPLYVYVAGKISARNLMQKEKNILMLEQYAIKIMEKGHIVFLPTFAFDLNLLTKEKKDEYGFWVEWFDFHWLRRCDAIFLCPGWEKSKGAKMERDFAEKHEIKIYTSLKEIPVIKRTKWSEVLAEQYDHFCRKERWRLLEGNRKYGDDWIKKDNKKEYELEALDMFGYYFLNKAQELVKNKKE